MKELDKEQIAEAAEQLGDIREIALSIVRGVVGVQVDGDVYSIVLTGIIVGILSPRLLGDSSSLDRSPDNGMRDVLNKLMDTSYPLDKLVGDDAIYNAMVHGKTLSDEEGMLAIIYLLRDLDNHAN